MRNLLALIFALVFVLHSAVLAAAPAHACCKHADCPLSQCVSADCLPSAMPAAAGKMVLPLIVAQAIAVMTPAAIVLPEPLRQIWSPPD